MRKKYEITIPYCEQREWKEGVGFLDEIDVEEIDLTHKKIIEVEKLRLEDVKEVVRGMLWHPVKISEDEFFGGNIDYYIFNRLEDYEGNVILDDGDGKMVSYFVYITELREVSVLDIDY